MLFRSSRRQPSFVPVEPESPFEKNRIIYSICLSPPTGHFVVRQITKIFATTGGPPDKPAYLTTSLQRQSIDILKKLVEALCRSCREAVLDLADIVFSDFTIHSEVVDEEPRQVVVAMHYLVCYLPTGSCERYLAADGVGHQTQPGEPLNRARDSW